MVAVAIIGVLAALALPNYRNYQLRTKRSEILLNLKAIYTAEKSFQVEKDGFKALTASPRPVAVLSAAKVAWQDNGGFTSIGWQPSGKLYGSYQASVAGTSGGQISADARSDIDGDGNIAGAIFYVDRAAPLTNQGVHMVTDNSVF